MGWAGGGKNHVMLQHISKVQREHEHCAIAKDICCNRLRNGRRTSARLMAAVFFRHTFCNVQSASMPIPLCILLRTGSILKVFQKFQS